MHICWLDVCKCCCLAVRIAVVWSCEVLLFGFVYCYLLAFCSCCLAVCIVGWPCVRVVGCPWVLLLFDRVICCCLAS